MSRAGLSSPLGKPPVALALAFAAMYASAPGQSFLISVFLDDMLSDTGLSRTTFSALYALATVVSATVSLLLGRASDRTGLRLAWMTTTVGLALACLLAAAADGLLLALAALALLRAFGQGSFPLLGTLIVNYAFSERRGAAMAAASFGITAATITLPPLVVLLIDGVGWRDAYRVLAVVILAVYVPLGFALRGRRGREPAPTATPAGVAFSFPAPARRSRRLRILIPRRHAAQLLGVFAAPPLVMTAVTFHAVSVLADRGLTLSEAAAALSVYGAASALATISSGVFSDRLSTRALLSAMSGALLVGSALLALSDSAAVAFPAFAAIGVSGGLFGVTSGIVWARTYGTAGLGRLQGVAFGAQIGAAALGPLPLALSKQLTGSYLAGTVFLSAVAALAFLGAVLWRTPLDAPRSAATLTPR